MKDEVSRINAANMEVRMMCNHKFQVLYRADRKLPWQDVEVEAYYSCECGKKVSLHEMLEMYKMADGDAEMYRLALVQRDLKITRLEAEIAKRLEDTRALLDRMKLPHSIHPYDDGEPCPHPGCLQHVTHPCEGCGRVAGSYKNTNAYLRAEIVRLQNTLQECKEVNGGITKRNISLVEQNAALKAAGDALVWYLLRADNTLSPTKVIAKWQEVSGE